MVSKPAAGDPVIRDPARDATLAIIAGGKARRLDGAPKGLLAVEGRTAIERLLELSPLFEDVILVADDPSPYGRLGLRAVADRVKGKGAPAGVQAALAAARTSWVVAVACDMPFVARAAVERLLEERSAEVDAVCFRVGGRLEPLLAVYRASLAPAWEEWLSSGPSFGEIYARLRARILPEEALRAVDAGLGSVASVNTPEDASRLAVEVPKKTS
ncbi:MAG: molybdenum cofactor guanylyltransferase [Myxococcales bacterium]|nr:molybdenum cofactor guanylyltransferase [Myxococcales bacterium]